MQPRKRALAATAKADLEAPPRTSSFDAATGAVSSTQQQQKQRRQQQQKQSAKKKAKRKGSDISVPAAPLPFDTVRWPTDNAELKRHFNTLLRDRMPLAVFNIHVADAKCWHWTPRRFVAWAFLF